MKNKMTTFWQRAILGFVFILCLTSCQFRKGKPPTDTPFVKGEQGATQKEIDEKESAQEEKKKVEKNKKETKGNQKNQSNNKNEQKSRATKVASQGSFAAWSGESAIQYWHKLEEVAKNAKSYYNSAPAIISKTGKMYHQEKQETILVPYLCKNTGLDQKYIDFSCDILLIRGSDLAEIEGANVPENSMGFGVFTAAKQPNGTKYMISSAEGNAGLLLEGSYRELLRKYNQDHGDVVSLSHFSDTYKRIMNFVRVYEGRYDKFYVRDVRADGKYAVVVFSPQENPNDIREYILRKDNNFWEVAIDDLERQYSLVQAVNRKIPDFNLALLPSYHISNDKNNLKADFSDVNRIMVKLGYMEASSQLYYQCGTTKYCYMMLYDGSKFVAHIEENDWTIQKVSSDTEAIDLIKGMGGREAPTFIVLDE